MAAYHHHLVGRSVGRSVVNLGFADVDVDVNRPLPPAHFKLPIPTAILPIDTVKSIVQSQEGPARSGWSVAVGLYKYVFLADCNERRGKGAGRSCLPSFRFTYPVPFYPYNPPPNATGAAGCQHFTEG